MSQACEIRRRVRRLVQTIDLGGRLSPEGSWGWADTNGPVASIAGIDTNTMLIGVVGRAATTPQVAAQAWAQLLSAAFWFPSGSQQGSFTGFCALEWSVSGIPGIFIPAIIPAPEA